MKRYLLSEKGKKNLKESIDSFLEKGQGKGFQKSELLNVYVTKMVLPKYRKIALDFIVKTYYN